MRIPFVNYPLQYKILKQEIDSAIQNVLEQGDLILRKDVDEFEKNLADFVGTEYAVGLNSGTDALFFSLLAAGIGKGDEVITVSHTFIASISTIIQAGAKPVLIDVADDYLIDANELEKAITPKTKAIIPVYLNGRMPDMDRIMDIAEKHNLIVIEDSAQALGASFNNKKAGSIGLTGCFSFYPAKILGCFGDGGAITTNNKEIADKIRILRDHGQKTKTELACYGYNSRLDNLQAAVLNVKLKHLPKWIERRREIAQIYGQGLKTLKEIKPLPLSEDEPNFDVFQNYVIRAEKRDNLFNFLKEKGIETLIKDPIPNHWQKGLNLYFNLPITEQLSKEVISLPMYPELSNENAEYVIECVKEYYVKKEPLE
jgi:dTDP-4-amino-4,6-dideoxygalactose transaminase